jgi:hypothetical protein
MRAPRSIGGRAGLSIPIPPPEPENHSDNRKSPSWTTRTTWKAEALFILQPLFWLILLQTNRKPQPILHTYSP